jgi:single-stranded-DNA-specific exonuclease
VNAYADERLGPDDLRPRIRVDGMLGFGAVTERLASQVASLSPFGPANPRPVFVAHAADLVDGPRRLKERHYKMALRHEGRVLRAIEWRGAERHPFLEGHAAPVDIAYCIEQNYWNGETHLEVSLCDVRPAAPAPAPLPAAVADTTAV